MEYGAGMSLTRTKATNVHTTIQSADHAEELMAQMQACAITLAYDHADNLARLRNNMVKPAHSVSANVLRTVWPLTAMFT